MSQEIFLQLSDTQDQTPYNIEPHKVRFNTNDAGAGIGHAPDTPENILIEEDGVYVIVAAGQVGRRTGSLLRHIDLWMRVNDQDVSNSGVRASAPASLFKGDTNVLVTQNALPLKKGDVVNIMMSVSEQGEGLGLIAFEPEHEPLIPSIIFTAYKI